MQHIVVVDYDPQWAEMFRAEAAKIKEILGKNCVAVYHIGSTAVEGLAAKPIIDIMPVVTDLAQDDRVNVARHLAVRDYLRSHPGEAAAYGALKRALAGRYPYDIEGYCDGKEAFVRALEKRALAAGEGACPIN